MLCSAARARPRRRPRRHPDPAAGDRRSACRSCEALGVEPDVVFDLDVTRNRPDACGHRGVARDLAAHLGVPFHPPCARAGRPTGRSVSAPVEIVAPDLCGRFTSIVLTGVEVGPSAPWMAERLDPGRDAADQQRGRRVELRDARAAASPTTPTTSTSSVAAGSASGGPADGETLVTLDDVERTFTADDLLICDGDDRPIGIAGVMGGARPEIRDATTDVRSRWRGSIRIGDRRDRGAARPALGGVGPLRARRRPVRHRPRRRPLRRAARGRPVPSSSSTPGAGRRAGRPAAASQRSVRVRPDRGQRPARRRARPTTSDDGRAARPDRLRRRHRRRRTACRTSASRRGGRTAELEIDVIEEVARHYGYERLGKTVPSPSVAGRLSAGPGPAAACCARCCSASGSARPCPSRSSRPATWPGPG